jgi:carbon-monoxide dehydrogenase medium subunit
MTPAPFAYSRAETIDEALQMIAGGDASIRVLAGGQSLIPLMKLRLARPERLVDVGRVEALRGIRDLPDGGLAIGALTTWAALLEDPRVTRYGVFADAIPVIGDAQVRNRGTIGGSLAHADPASDIAAPALALRVALVARSAARGERTIAIDDFFSGPFATVLEPDEMLVEVRVPATPAGASSAYRALPQPASGYPIAGVAVALSRSVPTAGFSATSFSACTIGVTGVGEQPYRATGVEAAVLAGEPIGDAARSIAEGRRVAADIHADRDYRAAMAAVMAHRAFAAASARLP